MTDHTNDIECWVQRNISVLDIR